jgi:hypothetical protein
MNKLALLVAVAISTAVVAQRPPRKVVVETTSCEVYKSGMITKDSVFTDYTFCEKLNFLKYGTDTSTLEKHWDFEYEFYDTLTHSYKEPERYVFDFRKGVVKYSKGSTRETSKITGFSYTAPFVYSPDYPPSQGSISVFTENKDGGSESYSLDFDSNGFVYYLASSEEWLVDQRRKEYKVSKITKK